MNVVVFKVWGIIFTSKALLDTSFIVRETPLIDIEPLEVINFFRLKGISIFNIKLEPWYFLETIFAGIILDIDILNQPAVEDSKILTKKYLS